MSLPVVYRLAASRETIEAARSYERLRPGLGISFLDELARIEGHLSSSPGLYQVAEDQIRRAVLRRFPFGLFYLEEADRILILACLDLRRDPQALSDLVGHR